VTHSDVKHYAVLLSVIPFLKGQKYLLQLLRSDRHLWYTTC